jgi:hypothetical protein
MSVWLRKEVQEVSRRRCLIVIIYSARNLLD